MSTTSYPEYVSVFALSIKYSPELRNLICPPSPIGEIYFTPIFKIVSGIPVISFPKKILDHKKF